jgi:asparagine synthase (glutamine-hydrolysing)
MCGIFMYHSTKPLGKEDIQNAKLALQAIDHRGPDGHGIMLLNTENGNQIFIKDESTPGFCNALSENEINAEEYNCILAHKRLSIFDLSENGFQPMAFDGDCIIFNGEIYNWLELRNTLENKAEIFRTKTDTELILKSFKHSGPAMLNEFNGMWAIIIWDNKNKKFFISRDRFGVKPFLYKILDDKSFILCSEEKQIVAFENKSPQINYKNVEIFTNEGHTGFDNSTYYEGIFSFSPAAYAYQKPIHLLENTQRKSFYSTQTNNYLYSQHNWQQAVSKFNEIFNNAIDLRLRADVPAGFSLSGGLDSSRIVYEAYHHENYQFKPEFFSAIFPGSRVNEENSIRTIAKDLNIIPNFCYPNNEFGIEKFNKLTYVLDSPVPDLSYFAQWSVSNLVREHNKKILVVGQGADEVFAGYHHHFYRYAAQQILHGNFKKAKSLIEKYAEIKSMDFEKVKQLVNGQLRETIKSKVMNTIKPNSGNLSVTWNAISTIDRLLMADLSTYQIPYFLKADDRIGMWHGFESRYPFLDYRLIDFGFQCNPDLKLYEGWQKWIIRKSFENAPESIVWRKDKVGYIMPMHGFFEDENLFYEAKEFLKNKINIRTENKYRIIAAYIWLKQYE